MRGMRQDDADVDEEALAAAMFEGMDDEDDIQEVPAPKKVRHACMHLPSNG